MYHLQLVPYKLQKSPDKNINEYIYAPIICIQTLLLKPYELFINFF